MSCRFIRVIQRGEHMPVSDLIYNSDLMTPKNGCGCGPDSGDKKDCDCNPTAYILPPPPPAIDVCRYPYPPMPWPWPYPVPPCPPGPEPGPDPVEPNATEKAICKLSRKAATVRQLIENLEDKNKALIIKSGAASYQLGVLKTTVDEEEITNENVQTIIEILKGELEKIKEEIKELSDKLVED